MTLPHVLSGLRKNRAASIVEGTPRRNRARRSLAALAIVATALGLVSVTATPAMAGTVAENNVSISVFTLLNAQRKANHLPALRRNTKLNTSARAHNAVMMRTNTMAHTCKGELPLSVRVSYFGYRWRSAAENIGWSSNISTKGAMSLQNMMYAEKAPYNGHRLNILNRSYRDVGVDVLIDVRHHKIWLTTDFGTPA